jgi:GDSL-like Lipase/Acylhydrolase
MQTIASPQNAKSATRRIHLEYTKLYLFVSLGILLQSCVQIRQKGESFVASGKPQFAGPSVFAAHKNKMPVLMVGDSLTVGGFGEAMQAYLLQRFGSNNVAVYASCGSSPEHWIRSGPKFITKCGYREQTPQTKVLYDFQNGRRPKHALTPKLEDLVERYHPKTVIVQLGTNWMDGISTNSRTDDSNYYGQILDRFVAAIRSEPNTVHKIIWITPPDSSRYSKAVETKVKNLITAAAEKHSFETIDSSRMTHYVPGKSGGDGVHYNSAAAKEWANQVTRELDGMLQ